MKDKHSHVVISAVWRKHNTKSLDCKIFEWFPNNVLFTLMSKLYFNEFSVRNREKHSKKNPE